MVIYKIFILVFCSMLFFLDLYAGSSPRNIVASKTNIPPMIDGIINEDVWKFAVPVSNFIQYDPIEGNEPTEKTSVRVLYDDEGLYFGVICYDSNPKGIREQLTRRDRSSEADRFSITIDSYNDGQTGFVFAGTVSGVQSDGILYHDGTLYDIQWDAVWDFAAKIFEGGWIAEFEIPYSALRFTKQEGEYVWGINFRRYIARKKEIDEWVMIPRNEVGTISKIGNVSGIIGINPPMNLTFLPYAVSNGNFEHHQKPYTKNKVLGTGVGLDVKYGITSNFTLDAAINPDFGQVEVDKEVMNLTVFETGYPEKRPFFLEGAHLFSFGVASDEKQLNLFYSRRIGRQPRYSYIEDAFKINKMPKNTTILGAVKLSGRREGGLTVGALSTVTETEKAIYDDISGVRKTKVVEPVATYNVIRLKQEVFGNSSIGLMTTGAFVNKNSPSIASGLDWNLRFLDNTFTLDGYFASSKYSEKGSLDGPIHKLYGNSGRLFFGKIAGDYFLFNTSYDYASKNFNINELGLFNQPREHGGVTQVIYKEDQASSVFYRYMVLFHTNYRWSFEGISTVKYFAAGSWFLLRNFWSLNFQLIRNQTAFEEASRGVPVGKYLRPSATQYFLNFTSDTRLPVSANTILLYETDTKQKKEFITSVNLTFRPLAWVEVTPMVAFSKRWKEEAGLILGVRYITANDALSGERFTVFGNRDLQYFDLALRGIVTLSTKLSIQFFSQVLFYKWQYSDLKLLNKSDELITYDILKHYIHPYYLGYTNLNYKIFNANIVLRWEYLPGSTLFFVWTQMRQEVDKLYYTPFHNNITNTFKIPSDNVVLLKLNYWLSL
ncbi:MAG: DUF5916 domain-containing protein [Bacteroidota bacterium]|nr:DUF5916 domain-containing protein [Bacteroidota bacterium]